MPITFWDEMKEQHGECLRVNENSRIYEDGTVVSGQDYPTVDSPPDDPMQKLRYRRRYLQAKVNQEVVDFTEFRSDCLNQQTNHERSPRICPPPHPRAEQMLLAGKERIEKLREQIQEIDSQLPDDQLVAKVNQAQLEKRHANQSRRSAISTIEI